jgi:hypothetical protein
LHATPPGSGAADSLELVFMGCNRNDYELTGDGFVTRLTVGGRAVGQGARERSVHLGTRDTSRFSVTLALGPDGLVADAEKAPFDIAGTSELRTPIGIRRLDFRLHGKVQRKGSAFEWLEEGQTSCRPGLSTLPAEFVRVPAPIREDSPHAEPGHHPGGHDRP